MGVAGMMSGLAGVRGECEPVDVVGDACYEHGERARGGLWKVRARGRWARGASRQGATGTQGPRRGASPGICWLVSVRSHLRGLAGVLGWCEPVDVVGDGRYGHGERARGGSWKVRARGPAGWCAWEAIFAGSQL